VPALAGLSTDRNALAGVVRARERDRGA